jgi:hypothetical protein
LEFYWFKLGLLHSKTEQLKVLKTSNLQLGFFLLPTPFYVNANAKQKTYGTLKADWIWNTESTLLRWHDFDTWFGQTKFDDQFLNLGPFEQQFNENRPFTEGTCLAKEIYCIRDELAEAQAQTQLSN